MEKWLEKCVKWLLGPEIARENRPGHLWARWIFLRALGIFYFSAFLSFLFQVKGLIGPNGILPAGDYLQAVSAAMHSLRFWFAPTLLWLGSGDRALILVCWTGAIASVLLVLNLWPRAALVACFICFLSIIAVAQDFASYQSDGMLLEAGFLSLFFAPPGLWPGLGRAHPASRASLFLLRWEWFCIYFGSGSGKIAGGDPSWRNFTAMDDYYQNGPLPTWIGWYAQHLPHWFHASTVFLTLAIELVLVWMVFLPRRFRIACFFIVTPFEIGIILTANYAFLNYLVLALGFLLLDDRFVEWIVPQRLRRLIDSAPAQAAPAEATSQESQWRKFLAPARMLIAGVFLGLILYSTGAQLVWRIFPEVPLPQKPIVMLMPFRVADRYGLFESMTHERREIEFQGSADGNTWVAYPFSHKPQDVRRAPGIYAPYQPRFEWNLWFASLGVWPQYRFVLWTEERILQNEPDVLSLFASNPFPNGPPRQVRAVIYRYWFTDWKTKRQDGAWWQRDFLGDYAPRLEREPDGRIVILDVPTTGPPSE